MDTFITDVLNTVDQVIGNFVQTSYQGLIQGNATVITLLFTFYIIVLGYRFVTHDLSSDLNTITRHLVSLLIVYGLICPTSTIFAGRRQLGLPVFKGNNF